MSTFLQLLIPALGAFVVGLLLAWIVLGARPGNA